MSTLVCGVVSRSRSTSAIRRLPRPASAFPALPATDQADTAQHGRFSGAGGAGKTPARIGWPNWSKGEVPRLGGSPLPGWEGPGEGRPPCLGGTGRRCCGRFEVFGVERECGIICVMRVMVRSEVLLAQANKTGLKCAVASRNNPFD